MPPTSTFTVSASTVTYNLAVSIECGGGDVCGKPTRPPRFLADVTEETLHWLCPFGIYGYGFKTRERPPATFSLCAASFRAPPDTMLYRWNTDGVLCPVIVMATRSGMPARTRFLTPSVASRAFVRNSPDCLGRRWRCDPRCQALSRRLRSALMPPCRSRRPDQ